MDKELLYKEYIENNLSVDEICSKYNMTKAMVYNRLHKYDIKKSQQQITECLHRINLQKYGVKSTSQLDSVKNKMKQTCLEKYGTTSSLLNADVKEKTKQTNLQRYGSEHSSSNEEVKQKIKQTTFNKYGVDVISKHPDYVNKMKQTNLQRYGSTCYLHGHDKIKIREKIRNSLYKHNRDCTIQEANEINNHIELYCGNKDILYDFINNNYLVKGIKPTITILAHDSGIEYNTIASYIRKYDLTEYIELNQPSSKYELELLDLLKSWGITNIILHSRQLIKPHEVDIYLPDFNLGIEFNGSFWHSEYNKDKKYHQDKSIKALENGFFIYNIYEYEWLNTNLKDKLINQLKNLLFKNDHKIYARKCEIKIINRDQKSQFLKLNHIQGNDSSKLNLGLFYKNELISVMTFCRPRFNKKYDWELSRYCSKNNTNVIGGASRLFKYFINNFMNDNETVISYNDIGKTKGTVYEMLGFEKHSLTSPNYIWWKKEDIYKTRYQTMMINESVIMHNSGYLKIYDSGNFSWIYKKE